MHLQRIATWRSGQEGEQLKNRHRMVATKWKPISTYCLHSLKEQKQRRIAKKRSQLISRVLYVHMYLSDLAERKNTFVHAQANIHQILLY